jgi:hypothetical protein
MKAAEAMKLSSDGAARRYDADGYAWVMKSGEAFRRVPETMPNGDPLFVKVAPEDIDRCDDWEPVHPVVH